MSHSISPGVFDWVRFPARHDFYPEDMPEAWRMSYYSNEFNSACLFLSGLESRKEEVLEWLEDLPQGFELSFYLEEPEQIPLLQSLAQQQDLQFYSLLLGERADHELLQNESLQTLLSLPEFAAVKAIPIDSVWRPEKRVKGAQHMAIFPLAENMKIYREWIEQWVEDTDAISDSEHKTLWLSASETDYQQLAELTILIELMGY